MAQLDQNWQALTGLNYTISDIIENADASEKSKLYEKLMWDIKAGVIMTTEENQALYEAIDTELRASLLTGEIEEIEEDNQNPSTPTDPDPSNPTDPDPSNPTNQDPNNTETPAPEEP